ncbi:MAG: L-2-amino-thiazoline-4-carboxylic acid hydrolase [Candidatus Hodarchaeales archaeon]
MNNYYTQNKPKLMKSFQKLVDNPIIEEKVFLRFYDRQQIHHLKHDVLKEYEKLIPQIPFIGGEKNKRMTDFLIHTAWSLAIYRTLSKMRMDLRQVGQILYEISEIYYNSLNFFVKKFAKWYYYSRVAQYLLKRNSRKRKDWNYPADFQGDLIKGDGKDFTIGYNYTECGNYKFLKEQGAEELTPYICITDYALYRALGIGFKRTKTIGMKADICDFRLIKNYQTPRGWPPEKLEDFKNYTMQNLKFDG